MSDEQLRRSNPGDVAPPPLPGPPPTVPDLAAVSASIERPRVAPVAEGPAVDGPERDEPAAAAPASVGTDEQPETAPERAPGESEWSPPAARPARPVVGPWALGLAIVALGASFVVGWMLPLGLVAVVVAIIALRRPVERRGVAVWALALGVVSVVYSVGWLLWAAASLGLLG